MGQLGSTRKFLKNNKVLKTSSLFYFYFIFFKNNIVISVMKMLKRAKHMDISFKNFVLRIFKLFFCTSKMFKNYFVFDNYYNDNKK
jgi:hypothetical protein